MVDLLQLSPSQTYFYPLSVTQDYQEYLIIVYNEEFSTRDPGNRGTR